MAFGQLVQTRGIGVEKRRHLIDERARATRAGSVHALLDAVVEVDDLRVFAAQFDRNISLGDERLDRRLRSDDLLHELDAEPLGKQQPARTGDRHREVLRRILCSRFLQHLEHRCAHIGMMTAIHGPQDLVRIVEHRKLHRGGANIDADMKDVSFWLFRFSHRSSSPSITIRWIRLV